MTKQELSAFYTDNEKKYSAELQVAKKRINLISNLRLLSAVGFIALLYFGLTFHYYLYALPLVAVIFIILVRRHTALFNQKVRLENLIKVQQNELKAVAGDFSVFYDGAAFLNHEHPYTHDLDIFGSGSLFQFLNRIHTYNGRKLLAERLSKRLASSRDIEEHQLAVRELVGKSAFRHEIQAAGMEISETKSDRDELIEWTKRTPFIFKNKTFEFLLKVLPPITLLCLALQFFIDGVDRVFYVLAFVQLVVVGTKLKQTNLFHEYISKKKIMLNNYAQLVSLISSEKFDTRFMMDLQMKMKNAASEISELANLVSTFNARGSMFIFFANALVLFDIRYVYKLERWKEKNKEFLEQWLDAVHEVEVLCSLGTFAFNNPEMTFPKINDTMVFDGVALGHPLIDKSERVTNSISLDAEKKVLIITGANMAGKSTFLRTIGVNIVLALAGAPVCAEHFNCPLIDIRSGMRTADSLKDHQSYFYAELNRLKSIVDELKTGKKLFILLDEILKGTNSTDKQYGSIALVKQLVQYNALSLIATHDLVLGELAAEFPGKIRNFCFEPSIENDQLSFDYLLKPGLAQKMNASFLMKKMGIIP